MSNLRNYNCGWCGIRVSGEFCGVSCRAKMKAMLAIEPRAFVIYSEAAKYLGRDVRTVRRYEGLLFWIDKSLPIRSIIWVTCCVCGAQTKSSENRRGFCKSCSKKGEGRKSQSSILSELYRGEGNPNYIDGKSAKTFRHQREGKEWPEPLLNAMGSVARAVKLANYKRTMFCPQRCFLSIRSMLPTALLCAAVITQKFIVWS